MPALSSDGSRTVKFIGVVKKTSSEVRIFREFCQGLRGLENYSHLIILYWFHQRDSPDERRTLQVTPRRHPGAPQVGVFASRSPSRPNSIGLCVAELIRIERCILELKGLDAIDGSPVIDIKPYLPRADSVPDAKAPEWTSEGPVT